MRTTELGVEKDITGGTVVETRKGSVADWPITGLPFGGIKRSHEPCRLPQGGTVGTGLDAACYAVMAATLVEA